MPKTPAEARALWIAALRSGEYAQGKKCLHQGDKFCCLGVACELYNEHQEPLVISEDHGLFSYQGAVSVLPEKCKHG